MTYNPTWPIDRRSRVATPGTKRASRYERCIICGRVREIVPISLATNRANTIAAGILADRDAFSTLPYAR